MDNGQQGLGIRSRQLDSRTGDRTFPSTTPTLARRFMSESTMAQACLRYLVRCVLQHHDPVDFLPTLQLVEVAIQEAALYGVVLMDIDLEPARVIPLHQAHFFARWLKQPKDYEFYGRYRDHAHGDRELKAYILRRPDVLNLRFDTPIMTAIHAHLQRQLGVHLQLQAFRRNVERPNFAIRPDGEESILRARIDGHDAVARDLFGADTALTMEEDRVSSFYESVDHLRENNAQRTEKRTNTSIEQLQREANVAAFSTLSEHVSTEANYNKVTVSDRGTTYATLAETRPFPDLINLMRIQDDGVCQCFGLTLTEVVGDGKSASSSSKGGKSDSGTAVMSPQATATVNGLMVLIGSLPNPRGKRGLRPRAQQNPQIAMVDPTHLLKLVELGVIDFKSARAILGISASAGPDGVVPIKGEEGSGPAPKRAK